MNRFTRSHAICICMTLFVVALWSATGRVSDVQAQGRQQEGDRAKANEAQSVKTVGIMRRQSVDTSFPNFPAADVNNGRAIVVGAATASDPAAQGGRPQACFSCHGLDGVGDPTGAFPRLSGQPAFYLYKQLLDYASGARPNEIMTPLAKALNQQQMIDVAAYYAAQSGAPAYPPQAVDAIVLQSGGALSAVGSAEAGIPACVNCHGPQGTGLAPSFPYLAGQYASYIELQLQAWKQGRRKNDPLGVMADIASRMSPEDIRGSAAYFAAMPPPGAETRVAVPSSHQPASR